MKKLNFCNSIILANEENGYTQKIPGRPLWYEIKLKKFFLQTFIDG